MIDLKQSVSSVVLEHPECASVFQRHRIDFCCRGGLAIEEACAERRVEPGALAAELSKAIAGRGAATAADPRGMSTVALTEHIVATHHQYLREALPFVERMAAKVHRVHGEHNPRLAELDEAVQELSELLAPHLDEEEQVLFPKMNVQGAPGDWLHQQLASMEEEHVAVGRLLERVRAAAEDFRLPDWACNSYRALFAELEQLEADVHQHLHLENNVLKPRFVAAAG